MRRLLRVASPFLLLLAACRLAAPPPAATAAPHLEAHASRVVLISFDGMAALRHNRLLAAGAYHDPAGLAAFSRWGYVVRQAIPVNPTLTAASHAAIATGAYPTLTGIVSNYFHVPGTPITEGVSGFNEPWEAESLWQAFHRQGKRVGVLAFPGCDDKGEARTADFGMIYVNEPLAPHQLVTLGKERFTEVSTSLPTGVVSFSPSERAALTVSLNGDLAGTSATFYLTAVDTIDDKVTAYDTLLVDDDPDPANGLLAQVHAGDWFPLELRAPHPDGGTRRVGAWCLLQSFPANLTAVHLYLGAFNATEAYPRAFRELLDREAGFWPGTPDDYALAANMAGKDGLALPDYLKQVERLSQFFSACARAAIANEKFDLLMAYQPLPDDVQHALTITDPRQRDYSPGLAATASKAVDDTYAIVDRAVGDLARSLDLARDALVLVSDHGIAPIWEAIHVNEVLRRAGLCQGEQHGKRWRVGPDSKVVAFTSGGCAHIYVNLAGREPGGVVPPEQRDEIVREAAAALGQLEVDGSPVVEQIYRHDELDRIGLANRNSGDLVVFFKEGFAPTSQIGGPTHEPARYYGQHGYLDTHPEMAGVWMARGAAVPRAEVDSASLTGVAAFVSRLAGVQPPAEAQR
jgi:predicted AlkP superfamily phosphohydrolase/phosphomutase